VVLRACKGEQAGPLGSISGRSARGTAECFGNRFCQLSLAADLELTEWGAVQSAQPRARVPGHPGFGAALHAGDTRDYLPPLDRDQHAGKDRGDAIVHFHRQPTVSAQAAVQIHQRSDEKESRLHVESPKIRGEVPSVSALPGDRRGSPFAGWSKAKSRLDELSGVPDWRLHDLRRTVATGLQRLGTRLEVTESILNHISGSRAGIVGVYQRHDWAAEKRAALEAWGARVAEIVEGREPARNVTPIRALSA